MENNPDNKYPRPNFHPRNDATDGVISANNMMESATSRPHFPSRNDATGGVISADNIIPHNM